MSVSGNLAAMGDALLAQAREEAQQAIAAARREAEASMNATEEEARQLVEEAVAHAEADARLEAQRRIAGAEVEAARIVAQAREAVLQQAMDRLAQRLRALPDEPEYPAALERLLCEAVAGLGRPDLAVQVRKDDRPLLTDDWVRRMSSRLGVSLHLHSEPAEISGGLIVFTPDRRLVFDQSFDALMRRHEEVLRSILARVLWPAGMGEDVERRQTS